MEVYLVRHGEAKSKWEDPKRPLSERGRAEVERVAALMAQAGARVEGIRHSGKLRAEETASILGEYLKPAGGLVATSGLLPNDDVGAVAESLALDSAGQTLSSVMLVGHLPFMSKLATLLLTGNPWPAFVDLPTATVICLTGGAGGWLIKWVVTPEFGG